MSLGTAIGAGIQALEALEDLHGIGYLHRWVIQILRLCLKRTVLLNRDVKPGNYTIGRAELNELRKVYILDFGMARKFTNDQVGNLPMCIWSLKIQGVIRKPRAAAGFRGTVRYAPISCHLQRELCR